MIRWLVLASLKGHWSDTSRGGASPRIRRKSRLEGWQRSKWQDKEMTIGEEEVNGKERRER